MAKLNFYRLNTGLTSSKTISGEMPPTCTLFDVTLSPEYKEKLEKRGKLGLTATGQPYIPEYFQTDDMLAEGLVLELDEDGRFDTPDASQDSKDVVKSILRQLKWRAGVDGWLPIEEQHQKYVAYWKTILDRSSPQDVIEELEKELKTDRSVGARKNMLEEKREAMRNKAKT